jgi:hypothetical protein
MADWASATDSDGEGNEEDIPPRRVTAAEAKKAHTIKPIQVKYPYHWRLDEMSRYIQTFRQGGPHKFYGFILWYSQQSKKGMLQTSGGAIRFAMSDSDSQKLPKTWMGMPVLFSTKAGRRQAANVEAIGAFQEDLPSFVYPTAMAGKVTRTNGVDAGAVTLYNAGNGLLRKSLPYDKANLQMTNKPELMPILGQEVDFYPGWNGTSLFLAQIYVRNQKSGNEALQPERDAPPQEKNISLPITTINKQRHMAEEMKVTVELGDICQQSYLPECFRINMAAIQAMEDHRTNQSGASRTAAYPLYLDPKSLVRATIQPTNDYLAHVEAKYLRVWEALHTKFPESISPTFTSFFSNGPSTNRNESKSNGADQEAGSKAPEPDSEVKTKDFWQPLSKNLTTIITESKSSLEETEATIAKFDEHFVKRSKFGEWLAIYRKNLTGSAHLHVHADKGQVGAWVQGIKSAIEKGRVPGVSAISISLLVHEHATKANLFHTSLSPIVSPNTGIASITLFTTPITPFIYNRSSGTIEAHNQDAASSKTVVATWTPGKPPPCRPAINEDANDLNDGFPDMRTSKTIECIRKSKDLQVVVQFIATGKKELPVQRFLSALRLDCFIPVFQTQTKIGPFTQVVITATDKQSKVAISEKLLAFPNTLVTDLHDHFNNDDAITLTLAGPRGINFEELRKATGVHNWALATPYFLRGVATEEVTTVANKVRDYVKQVTKTRPPILRIEHTPSGFSQSATGNPGETRQTDLTATAAIVGFPMGSSPNQVKELARKCFAGHPGDDATVRRDKQTGHLIIAFTFPSAQQAQLFLSRPGIVIRGSANEVVILRTAKYNRLQFEPVVQETQFSKPGKSLEQLIETFDDIENKRATAQTANATTARRSGRGHPSSAALDSWQSAKGKKKSPTNKNSEKSSESKQSKNQSLKRKQTGQTSLSAFLTKKRMGTLDTIDEISFPGIGLTPPDSQTDDGGSQSTFAITNPYDALAAMVESGNGTASNGLDTAAAAALATMVGNDDDTASNGMEATAEADDGTGKEAASSTGASPTL